VSTSRKPSRQRAAERSPNRSGPFFDAALAAARAVLRAAATSAPRQSDPNDVVSERRRERDVGSRGTCGDKK
jgi:hypothetical protein